MPRHALFFLLVSAAAACASSRLQAQTGSANEPVRYVGGVTIHQQAHDGQLRPAVGVESFEVMRANRTHPERADNFGWTYNHAPMIEYWNGRFYIEYLSNPLGEHIAPGQTLLCTSVDGRNWDFPKVVFPVYELRPPDKKGEAMMHQRMGFFIAPDRRLLVMAFYAHAPHPFGLGGIGRVVREIDKDGSFGPIYFLHYATRAGWGESNTGYPFYKHSPDAGFVAACDAMLANRLMREQWWDEEHTNVGDFFAVKSTGSQEAFNWYHRKDGKLVGLWKWSMAALSSDEGKTWSKPVKCPTLVMAGAKITGRRTSDGRYVLIYNPAEAYDGYHRWPLAIMTSDEGIVFDDMLCLQGEVPWRRFAGRAKDFGSQYNRCIEEGNGQTPGSDLWVTYSMNKEDIWISRVPIPVRGTVTRPVHDTFDDMHAGGPVVDWNIYSGKWAPVRIADFPSSTNRSLELSDKDPYDYARAIRVFPESKKADLSLKVCPKQNSHGRLEIDVVDRFGNRPVRLAFTEEGKLTAESGADPVEVARYSPGRWYKLDLALDVPAGTYRVSIDGKAIPGEFTFAEYVKSVERLSLRTGEYRSEPTRSTPRDDQPDFTDPNPDEPEPLATYAVDDVVITPTGSITAAK